MGGAIPGGQQVPGSRATAVPVMGGEGGLPHQCNLPSHPWLQPLLYQAPARGTSISPGDRALVGEVQILGCTGVWGGLGARTPGFYFSLGVERGGIWWIKV